MGGSWLVRGLYLGNFPLHSEKKKKKKKKKGLYGTYLHKPNWLVEKYWYLGTC